MPDLNTLLSRQLKRRRPTGADGSGTFDVSLSSDTVLSKIKYVLKTGIDSFDETVGGLPFGRMVEVYGLEMCGKTATCIRAMVKAQVGEIYRRDTSPDSPIVTLTKLKPDEIDVATLYIDNEQSIDQDQKTNVDGVEMSCIILRCDTVDQLFKITDITIDKMAIQQAEEDERAKKDKRTPKIILTVIIVDTIAGTSSHQEMVEEWNKEDFQRQPKMLRKGFRRLQRKINRNNILMICTNQVSENFNKARSSVKFSVPQAGDYTTFGGRAIRYYASIRVFMYQIMDNYKIQPTKFSQGLLIGFYTVKNRVVKPCRSARMVLLWEGGLNNDFSRFETLAFLGLITYSKSTKGYRLRFEDNGIDTTTFPAVAEAKRRKSAGEQLEDDDTRGRTATTDPELPAKHLWPAFCAEHKADTDLLWERAKVMLFDDKAIADVEDDGIDDDADELD